MIKASSQQTDRPDGPGMREFIALMAALMASNALAIDAMLPALPAIGRSLDVTADNQRQLVITAFILGFGVAQLFWGPLADRFGRKRLLTGGLILYGLLGIVAGLASTFPLLLTARVFQGMAAAAMPWNTRAVSSRGKLDARPATKPSRL